MTSQRWRVYIVDLDWELFHTQYVLFGASVDDVALHFDYCRDNFHLPRPLHAE
jgi:hypothetical protein